MVNSGSSANLLMIAALFYCTNNRYSLSTGDEVIVPAVLGVRLIHRYSNMALSSNL